MEKKKKKMRERESVGLPLWIKTIQKTRNITVSEEINETNFIEDCCFILSWF